VPEVTVTQDDIEETAVPYTRGRLVVSGSCEEGRVTITTPKASVPGTVDVSDEQVAHRWWEVPDTEDD
jgi:hypothetical protein